MLFQKQRDFIYRKKYSRNFFWKIFHFIKDIIWIRGREIKNPILEKNLNTPLRKIIWTMQESLRFKTTYFGVMIMKCPIDFWVYMEIIYEIKPDIIIEIGTLHGGATLALAHILDNIGKGKIISLDIDHSSVPSIVKNHPRITLITGDACQSFQQVKTIVKKNEKVLVIEDSSHTYENTLNVIRTFNTLVTPGSYLIVEDSILNHGIRGKLQTGPSEAIETFLKENKNFYSDRTREKFIITWNPKGYLKRGMENKCS